jgi:hypothetical protein
MIVSRSLKFNKCFTIKEPIATLGLIFDSPVVSYSIVIVTNQRFLSLVMLDSNCTHWFVLGKLRVNNKSKFTKVNCRRLE